MTKFFIILGLVFLAIGLALHFNLYKHFPLGQLPGDITVKREGFSFYFPITSGLVVSALFYLASKIWN